MQNLSKEQGKMAKIQREHGGYSVSYREHFKEMVFKYCCILTFRTLIFILWGGLHARYPTVI